MVNVKLVYNEVIEEVDITGDFFLEPAEALEGLEGKIEGLETGVSVEKIVERLEQVDAELIGFSRKDIAEAVREALR